ncbi:ABC transporter ATP-binding protein [Pseudodesulfovibrio sp.]|uniref:ABC transporter ATP-binding protein n=1 Tax=Pseudodesulfovibrio sp. TaxID=2035812 RepID=UPI002620BFD0|nr:ABC transporter ATP-binding protein [Pseudodesulfovibrio sp.]MDD3313852.1 ABC transporter ATP-binding protein [Pseudodesulfovibrio sp.]
MILDTAGVYFSYNGSPVFSEVSFAIAPGEIVSVVGPNGAGKSSLLKCLNGLLAPVCGTVNIAGKDVRRINRKELGRTIGYVPQHDEDTFGFSVLEIVLMGRAAHIGPFGSPTSRDVRIAEEAIADVGLESMAHKNLNELSGGQAQLAIVARALAAKPRLLLLDEPTSHLDIRNQALVLKALHSLSRQQGLSVLMTTHSPDHAFLFSDKVLMLRQGATPLFGKPRQVMTAEALGQVFGIDVQIINIDSWFPEARTVVPDWFGVMGQDRLRRNDHAN